MSKDLQEKTAEQSANAAEWKKRRYSAQRERLNRFSTISDMPVPELGTEEDLASWNSSEQLGFPGEYPYTRGVQPTMYRGRLWTMRQFAGFGTPEDTNARFHYLLQHGQTGLSTAFDMPTLMGYDPDHELSRGEVGREGVSVSTIEDMERLFADIDLAAVTTSMTINCSAAAVLAMYFALGRRRGVAWSALGGTIQNDILKEYIAQKEWICPPAPGVRIVGDMIEFCADFAPRFHAVSISGYHIREAGATAVQELAFTLYNGITYVEECLRRGRNVDSFAPRLSFFFDVHNDFFEEIAKFRAARRIWARLMKERFGAKQENSLKLRTHAQTAGVSLTAQQPMNNIARVALQALAAVLGGTQSLHTNSMDETLALPTEEAVKVALRTQQIIAEETGVANTIDPLGGSYFVEQLTDAVEAETLRYIERLDQMGGMLAAIEAGFPQKEIAESAYRFQCQLENGEKRIVGVNCYADDESKVGIPTLRIDPRIETQQLERIRTFKAARDETALKAHIEKIRAVCSSTENLMPVLIDAVDFGVTLGEISDVYRQVFGVYRDPGLL
jgi:methylmalonyl-CoA mutase N-terminal domain/subunit